MARFLKLTNAMFPHAGAPVAINIDQITSILPYNKNDPYIPHQDGLEGPQTLIYTGAVLYYVREDFDKITGSLPN